MRSNKPQLAEVLPGFESPAADVRFCEPSYRRSHTGLPYIRKSQLGSGQSAPRRRDRRSSRISTPGFSRRGESRNFFLLVLNRKFSKRRAVYFHFNPCAFEERRLWKNRLKPFHTCWMWKYLLHSFRGINESKHPRCQKGFKKTYFFPSRIHDVISFTMVRVKPVIQLIILLQWCHQEPLLLVIAGALHVIRSIHACFPLQPS